MDQQLVSLIISMVAIHLLAVMSPGPDFIMLVRNAIAYSRKTGYYTAIGFGFGIGVHVLYSVFGLGLIISKSPFIFDAIKYMGAAYLAYIGILSFKSTSNTIDIGNAEKKQDITSWKAVQIGFLTNVINPKATLFFLSLFTLVVSPDASTNLLVGLGIVLMVNTTLWFCFLAYLVTHSRILPTLEKYQNGFNKTFGVILIGIAIKVAFF